MSESLAPQDLDATTRLDLAALRASERDRSGGADEAGRAEPTRPDERDALLVCVRGPNTGSKYPLTSPAVTVGRSRDSDIVLDDVTVSRQHARLDRRGDLYTVADLGSLNGTYVNLERIESANLEDNDEIQIGKFRLVYQTAR
jgi:pSer/pThr/pTyr-binding forkhead associated (FHA) protein